MANQTIMNTAFASGDRNISPQATRLVLDPDSLRPVEYRVYIYSVSKRAFEQPNAIYGTLYLPACPKDKRYIQVFAVDHPKQIPTKNVNDPNGPPIMVVENGKRLALGICNPDYIGTDLSVIDKDAPAGTRLSSGTCNLIQQGVFPSLNDVPTEEELVKAEKRREAYYRNILQEADLLERSDPKRLAAELTLDHHLAADYFGIDANWHRAVSAKLECPNCGDKIKEGLAFHYSNGRICVLDWERAYLAGAVKKDEVPEEKRWWEPKRGPGRPPKQAEV